jgi:hypothetical protein
VTRTRAEDGSPGRDTFDTYVTVHLWLERSTAELGARLRSPSLVEEPCAVGLEKIQVLVSSALRELSRGLESRMD